MADRLNQQRKRRDDGSWLTMLVQTMNQVSGPEAAKRACDRWVIDALIARLERPAMARHPADLTPSL